MENIRSKVVPFIENSVTNQTDGIFSYIQEQTNVQDLDSKGIVTFTTNYAPSGETVPLNLIDKTANYWASLSYLDAYLLIDFKKNKVVVSDYIILNSKRDFPREWKIIGSNNNVTWKLISNEKTDYPSNGYESMCLRFKSQSLERFRYIKIIQLKERSSLNGKQLVFREIELYGVFYNHSDLNNKSCFHHVKNYMNNSILFIVLLIY